MDMVNKEGEHTGSPLPKIVHRFKTMSTHNIFSTTNVTKYLNFTTSDNKQFF